MLTITTTKQTFNKKPGTNTVWQLIETESEQIDRNEYDRIVESAYYFRNLGGYERHTKGYRCIGNTVTKIVTITKDKQTKWIRTFDFKCK